MERLGCSHVISCGLLFEKPKSFLRPSALEVVYLYLYLHPSIHLVILIVFHLFVLQIVAVDVDNVRVTIKLHLSEEVSFY